MNVDSELSICETGESLHDGGRRVKVVGFVNSSACVTLGLNGMPMPGWPNSPIPLYAPGHMPFMPFEPYLLRVSIPPYTEEV